MILVLLVATLIKPKQKDRIILYGHKFNGNIKAFHDYIAASFSSPLIHYLTLDYKYYLNCQNEDVHVLNGLNIKHCWMIVTSKVFMSDHGSGIFFLLKKILRNKICFIDVWHGVGHKGQTSKQFNHMHLYDLIFVSSPFFSKMYEQWGFRKDQIKVTGYARTDVIINRNKTKKTSLIKKELGFSGQEKILLFAPTYNSQENRSLSFNNRFFLNLEGYCEKIGGITIIRLHLNAAEKKMYVNKKLSRIKFMSMEEYPDTEKLLLVTDILITDWSSIMSDYLLLKRPVIFIDVKPGFTGYTLLPIDRPGKIVKNESELFDTITYSLTEPNTYMREYNSLRNMVIKKCWNKLADGHSSRRYLEALGKYVHTLKVVPKN